LSWYARPHVGQLAGGVVGASSAKETSFLQKGHDVMAFAMRRAQCGQGTGLTARIDADDAIFAPCNVWWQNGHSVSFADARRLHPGHLMGSTIPSEP
jgi:hypothetical protein